MDRPREGAVLDRRTLNRSLLARQLLLERVETPALEVVQQLVGMQAQVPLDPYVGLWSRLSGFDPAALGQALLERRLVRMTLLRATLHLVGARDAHRVRAVLQGMLERAFASSPFARNLAGLDLEPVLQRGIELVEQEPLTVAQLAAALGAEWPAHDPNSLAYAVRYLVPLVQVTPRGVWGATMRPTVTTLRRWIGEPPPIDTGVDDVVLRYLRAFGPASTADIRAWSWLTGVRAVISRLRPKLCSYRDEAGHDLYDVRDGLFCDPSAAAPVRFLPQYDNVFLAHADRGRLMDEVKWGRSFAHRGSLFVDGFLSGAWRLTATKPASALTVELHRRVRRIESREVRLEAGELLSFLTPEARSRRLILESG